MEVFSAHQAFALQLYNTLALANEGKNFLMSPLSIFAALSLVLPGAKKETLSQMLRAMRLNTSAPLENTEEALGKMLAAAVGTGGPAAQLLLANKAYIQSTYDVRQEYLAALRKHLSTDIVKVDFARDPDAERKRINDWVETFTKGKIANLLAPEAVSHDTRFVLVNALYFKANWSKPFKPHDTMQRPFYTNKNAAPVSVLTMHQTDFFPIIDVPNILTAVRFDLAVRNAKGSSQRTSIFAILPAERHGLDALLSGLSTQDWLRAINTPVAMSKVWVALPKLRLTGRAELSEPAFLPSLGIRDLFIEGVADLSGIGPGDLYVNVFTHQAVLELDEFGAEGAAATAVGGMTTSIEIETPREIKFDQPFMLILAKEVGDAGASQLVPIFMGRVSDPSQA